MVLERLKSLNKDYYTIADLEKIFGTRRKSLLVGLSRLKKRGKIIRLRKGLYQLPQTSFNLEKIATINNQDEADPVLNDIYSIAHAFAGHCQNPHLDWRKKQIEIADGLKNF